MLFPHKTPAQAKIKAQKSNDSSVRQIKKISGAENHRV